MLPDFLEKISGAGCERVVIHARKAWLQGLSPKENRDIPPLDYDRVHRLKADYPNLFIGINGGIGDLNQALEQLEHVDGVMLGRAAYHNASLLSEVDGRIFGDASRSVDWGEIRDTMMDYAARHMASGGRLAHVTRHMVGLFQGIPGARRYRQILSSEATSADASPEVIARAFAEVDLSTLGQAA